MDTNTATMETPASLEAPQTAADPGFGESASAAAAPESSGSPAADGGISESPSTGVPAGEDSQPQQYPQPQHTVDWKKRYDDLRRSENQLRSRLRSFERQQKTDRTPAPQPGQQPPPASANNNWYGFGSADTYQAALQRDPQSVTRQVLDWGVRNNSDFIKGLVREQFQELTAGDREHAFLDHLSSRSTDFLARYPEAQEGSPLHSAWGQWMSENLLWGDEDQMDSNLRSVAEALPGVNISEMCFKMAHYDILRQENQALKQRLGLNARTAVTAQPAGGRSVAKGNSHVAIAEQVLEEARQRGIRADADDVGAFARAMQRVMPNFGKKKVTNK